MMFWLMAASSPSDRTALYTPAEVARKLRVSERTLRRWAHEGRIRRVRLSYRVSRYTAASIEALVSPVTSEAQGSSPEREAKGAGP